MELIFVGNKIPTHFINLSCKRRQFLALAHTYRTVTEWERDMRHAPDYVVRLLEYYIRMEKLLKKDDDEKG